MSIKLEEPQYGKLAVIDFMYQRFTLERTLI